jgi:hypothetical protein
MSALCCETAAATLAVSTRSRDQRTWNIFERRVVGGTARASAEAVEPAENSMISTSRFVLRGALAAAIAVFASTHCGAPALAQQVAVNTEDGANAEDQTGLSTSDADTVADSFIVRLDE